MRIMVVVKMTVKMVMQKTISNYDNHGAEDDDDDDDNSHEKMFVVSIVYHELR